MTMSSDSENQAAERVLCDLATLAFGAVKEPDLFGVYLQERNRLGASRAFNRDDLVFKESELHR